jgi:hypothetical protein
LVNGFYATLVIFINKIIAVMGIAGQKIKVRFKGQTKGIIEVIEKVELYKTGGVNNGG